MSAVINGTNKWEIVGKPATKSKKSVQNSSSSTTKNQRKTLKDNLPKIDVAPPVKESATIYDVFTEKAQKVVKDQNKTTISTSAKRQQPRKKTEDTKNEAASAKSLEAAVHKINAAELEDILARDKALFPDNPSVWLKDFASYINLKLDNIPETDPVFTGKPLDYPSCQLPDPVRKLLEHTINGCSSATLEIFLEHCLKSMIADMGRGISSMGYKILIQLLTYEKPDIPVSQQKMYVELLNTNKNRPLRCLSVLWAAGQAGIKDLSCGLRIWQEIMVPVFSIRAVSTYAVEYIENLFGLHKDLKKGYGVLGFREFFPIMDRVYAAKTSLPSQLQKTFLAVYPKIKELSFGAEPESCMREFFPSFLARLKPDCGKSFRDELLSCLVYCLSKDQQCFSVWKKMYVKHMVPSSILMQHILQTWDSTLKKIDYNMLKENVSAFTLTNEEIAAKGKVRPDGFEESVELCNVVLKKRHSSTLPFLKMMCLLFLSILTGVLLTDLYNSKGFQGSRTRKLLSDFGLLTWVEFISARIAFFFQNILQWGKVNIPYYFHKVCEVTGPYLHLLWAKIHAATVYIITEIAPLTEWLKIQGQQAFQMLQVRLPVLWASIVDNLSLAWDFIVSFGQWLWQYIAHMVDIMGIWLKENVFTKAAESS